MAGLVPQRDPVRRRPEGPALPHHRPRVRDVLAARHGGAGAERARYVPGAAVRRARRRRVYRPVVGFRPRLLPGRSEENTSELQSLMRLSYAVLSLKKKK